jgi:uncharacterized membrane protein YecN with MAPEG domain
MDGISRATLKGDHMPITAIFAGLLTLLYVVLTVRVVGARRGQRVSLGDGGNIDLTRRIRAHANFAEYTPLALLMMALAENLKATPLLLWAIGVLLVIGRLSHAYAISVPMKTFAPRVLGMVLTIGVMIVLALLCLTRGIQLILL